MGERLVIGTAPRKRLPVKPIAVVAGVGLLLSLIVTRLVFFELVQVRGDTMAPNAMEGDVLLVSSLGDPTLGSVVLVEQAEREVLRRVVGLAGDHIATADGVLLRNGVPLDTAKTGVFGWLRRTDETEDSVRPHRQALVDEAFADGRWHHILGDHDGAARPWRLELPEVQVPPGHVFVLCDNRRICPLDDQAGPVAIDRIGGVARWLLWYGGAREVPPESRPFYGAFRRLGSVVAERPSRSDDGPAAEAPDQGSPASPPSDAGVADGASTGSGAAGDVGVDSPRK